MKSLGYHDTSCAAFSNDNRTCDCGYRDVGEIKSLNSGNVRVDWERLFDNMKELNGHLLDACKLGRDYIQHPEVFNAKVVIETLNAAIDKTERS